MLPERFRTQARPNLYLILGVTLVSQLLFLNAPILDGAGMAVLVVRWLPLLGGIVSLVSYFLARMLVPTLAYWVTVLSVLMQAYLLFMGYFPK